MKPYDQITILRNLHRINELRAFRDQVESYFARSERDETGAPMDWEGALAARSRINQLLPRVIRVVRAAGLGGTSVAVGATDPGIPLGRVDVLHQIFSAGYREGLDQEILDVLDMAIGVYQGDRFSAVIRTVNPLHYASTVLGFLARGPRRVLAALGFRPSARPRGLGEADLARLEFLAARLPGIEEAIANRLAAAQDRDAFHHAEVSRQLAELAERLDFAERMLAREQGPRRLAAPAESDVPTPV
ncbi:MAG: hypothetical protein JNJ80_22765 [Gemmatimonadetes bacterium]|nr:hypothetical protein [Gemmatimonadota bacterium]MCC7131103.1 hypothetical protein [Gemmatimonadales bacterium]